MILRKKRTYNYSIIFNHYAIYESIVSGRSSAEAETAVSTHLWPICQRMSETTVSTDLQLLQALAVQCAARARGNHRNAPVKAKLLLRQLRQPFDLMRPATERLNELGGAHGDPEPCADGSTHRREARADEH